MELVQRCQTKSSYILAREIQEALRTCDTGDIDPKTALEIYAHLLANISEVVSDADLPRLVILEAAMFRQIEKTEEL